MSLPQDTSDYLRRFAPELGERIIRMYPALYQAGDPPAASIQKLLRQPFPAQQMAIMGIVKRWEQARTAAVIAECGAGKTLISLGAVHTHSAGRGCTALAMVPPQLVEKWAREAFMTLPRIRVFFIDGLKQCMGSTGPAGINEVRLKNGRILRQGFHTTLPDLRLRKTAPSARKRWGSICPGPSLFVVGRDRAKLSYFWRHAYLIPQSGAFQGTVINPDTGLPICEGENRLLASDFAKVRRSQMIGSGNDSDCGTKSRRPFFSPLWQADEKKIRRFAPVEFIGRYLPDFFDFAIADEVHELKGDTAQGNALGTLISSAQQSVVLTGTLLGGYADDLFNILFRLEPGKMMAQGFEWGESGVRAFMEGYGVLEKVTVIHPEENACSKARVTKQVKRRPGASPLLFGHFLMNLGAFISLEDISEALPPYEEQVIRVPMDPELAGAYSKLEEDVKQALQSHRGNRSVLSVALNTLLLYPDRPFGLGDLLGVEYDPLAHRRTTFVITQTRDLDPSCIQAKERKLIEEVKAELAEGRCCQIYAVYTQKRDVTRRLETILSTEGIRVAVLTSQVPPDQREIWYERQLRNRIEVVICHPRLVQTGLDLIQFPTIIFYQSGYSIYVLRQASRRSWRIGQTLPVKVKFLYYEDTVQASCLRLMGKKLLVSLAMEGKFSGEGLQAMDEADDLLMAMARELVNEESIGESADAVWRNLRRQSEELLPSRAMGPEEIVAATPADRFTEDTVAEEPQPVPVFAVGGGPVAQLALFEHFQLIKDHGRVRKTLRSQSATPPNQQSLF